MCGGVVGEAHKSSKNFCSMSARNEFVPMRLYFGTGVSVSRVIGAVYPFIPKHVSRSQARLRGFLLDCPDAPTTSGPI